MFLDGVFVVCLVLFLLVDGIYFVLLVLFGSSMVLPGVRQQSIRQAMRTDTDGARNH